MAAVIRAQQPLSGVSPALAMDGLKVLLGLGESDRHMVNVNHHARDFVAHYDESQTDVTLPAWAVHALRLLSECGDDETACLADHKAVLDALMDESAYTADLKEGGDGAGVAIVTFVLRGPGSRVVLLNPNDPAAPVYWFSVRAGDAYCLAGEEVVMTSQLDGENELVGPAGRSSGAARDVWLHGVIVDGADGCQGMTRCSRGLACTERRCRVSVNVRHGLRTPEAAARIFRKVAGIPASR